MSADLRLRYLVAQFFLQHFQCRRIDIAERHVGTVGAPPAMRLRGQCHPLRR